MQGNRHSVTHAHCTITNYCDQTCLS